MRARRDPDGEACPGRHLLDRELVEPVHLAGQAHCLAGGRLEDERLRRKLAVELDVEHLEHVERLALVARLCAQDDAPLGVNGELDLLRAESERAHTPLVRARHGMHPDGASSCNFCSAEELELEARDEPDGIEQVAFGRRHLSAVVHDRAGARIPRPRPFAVAHGRCSPGTAFCLLAEARAVTSQLQHRLDLHGLLSSREARRVLGARALIRAKVLERLLAPPDVRPLARCHPDAVRRRPRGDEKLEEVAELAQKSPS